MVSNKLFLQTSKYLLIGIIGITLIGCNQKTDFDVVPSIDYKGINKTEVVQGREVNDSIFISISFKDGDGDLGFENNKSNIFLKDSRDGFVTSYSSPVVPESGAENGIEGTITILLNTLFNVCCYFPDGMDPCTASTTYPTDTVSYTITIEDRAGHISNAVTTPPIIILCN